MLRKLGTHILSQWMGATALFLVLGGGAAYAAGTIGSADIVDESILTVDIRNDQIRSADVRNDSFEAGGLRSEDLAPGSVKATDLDPLAFAGVDIAPVAPGAPFGIPLDAIQGSEVSDGTITGADVLESSLSGFDAHDAYRDHCDTPSDNTFRDCLSVTFDLGRSMQVLVMYGGGGHHGSFDGEGDAYGECRTRVDGANRLEPVNVVSADVVPVGMAAIFDVMTLSAGTHTVTLACRENPTDLEWDDLTIAVLELAFD